jgi:hypothetical protein
LPAALLEELATSVRVMARLLWTVHLDYSQVGEELLGGEINLSSSSSRASSSGSGGSMQRLSAHCFQNKMALKRRCSVAAGL